MSATQCCILWSIWEAVKSQHGTLAGLEVMRGEIWDAFVGGTIVRYTGKCFQGNFFSPPSTFLPPIPSQLLKVRVSITRFAFDTLQYLKILWVFGFYFTVCGCSFCLCCLLLGVPGSTTPSVCFTWVPGECCASLCREDVLVHGVPVCDADWSDSLILPWCCGHCFFWQWSPCPSMRNTQVCSCGLASQGWRVKWHYLKHIASVVPDHYLTKCCSPCLFWVLLTFVAIFVFLWKSLLVLPASLFSGLHFSCYLPRVKTLVWYRKPVI